MFVSVLKTWVSGVWLQVELRQQGCPAKNRLKRPSAWQTPSNCRHFHNKLYQIHFSGCPALPETRLQSLPHPYADRRTDFRDQKSSDFSGEIFRERNYCPRTAFSGSNSRLILSNQVNSWYGSRAVGCPLGREITAKTCSLLGNEGTHPDFQRFFLEKRPWTRFSTNVLIRGKWIHSTAK